MGYQIIRQDPDDLYAIFDSSTDTIILWDASADEVVDWFVEQEVARVRERVTAIVGHVARGEPRRAYFQFAMSWEDAQRKDREHDGAFSTGIGVEETPSRRGAPEA
jgi:hypothetical protein